MKMEQKRQKRGENWSSEEKDILRQLVTQSAHILEDKCTKTNINLLKIKEWHKVLIKLNKITGKNRSISETRLAWKRMKMLAKSNISANRQELLQTGAAQKPPSPFPEGAKGGEEKGANKRSTNRYETARESIIESDIDFKKRHLELLEIESVYNIEIAKLKMKKLNLEIDLLQTQKNRQNE